jgi:hypothetical protein
LDICDLGQLFGIQGLQLATVSQPIWISILALSEASAKLLRPHSSHVINGKALGGPTTSDIQLDVTAMKFLRALDQAKNCITNISTAWSPERRYDKELLEALGPHAVGRNMNSAIYWLLVRLGKPCCQNRRLFFDN